MRIFINYRHQDTAWVAEKLRHKLSERYGADTVFLDSEEIRPGEDYRTVLWPKLARSTVLLVVIGPQWLTVRAAAPADAGAPQAGPPPRRIDLADDDLRKEIELALCLGVTVIPVLIDDAPMPSERDLPDPLKPLASRGYVRLNAATVQYEIQRLLGELDRLLGDVDGFPEPHRDARRTGDTAGSAATETTTERPRHSPHFDQGGIYNAGPTTVLGDPVGRDKYGYCGPMPS